MDKQWHANCILQTIGEINVQQPDKKKYIYICNLHVTETLL